MKLSCSQIKLRDVIQARFKPNHDLNLLITQRFSRIQNVCTENYASDSAVTVNVQRVHPQLQHNLFSRFKNSSSAALTFCCRLDELT